MPVSSRKSRFGVSAFTVAAGLLSISAAPVFAASMFMAPVAGENTAQNTSVIRVQGAPVPCDTGDCSINEEEMLPPIDGPMSGDAEEIPGMGEADDNSPIILEDTKPAKELGENMQKEAEAEKKQ